MAIGKNSCVSYTINHGNKDGEMDLMNLYKGNKESAKLSKTM